jgi:hypothetical protein
MYRSILLIAVVVASVGCWGIGPEVEVKRVVVLCVQEPAVVLQEYYGRPRVVSSVSEKAPADQILDVAKRNRKRELDTLAPKHRALVEARVRELVDWINANTRIVTASSNPRGAPGVTEVQLPSSEALNQKAKSLCTEIFRAWSPGKGSVNPELLLISSTVILGALTGFHCL